MLINPAGKKVILVGGIPSGAKSASFKIGNTTNDAAVYTRQPEPTAAPTIQPPASEPAPPPVTTAAPPPPPATTPPPATSGGTATAPPVVKPLPPPQQPAAPKATPVAAAPALPQIVKPAPITMPTFTGATLPTPTPVSLPQVQTAQRQDVQMQGWDQSWNPGMPLWYGWQKRGGSAAQ